MRVLVTGAGGFVGRALVRSLVQRHEVVALDRDCGALAGVARVEAVEGDLADRRVLDLALGKGCDALIHLATLPGGASEQDPEAGWRINMDSSFALLEGMARQSERPRVVFASSIAVFGHPMPAQVDDATPLRPRLLYGAHKAMIEQWIATLTRRGAIDGLSLRLSGIVARPPGPSGMKSAFMSEIFHAAMAKRPFVAPVSPAATMWLMSVNRIAANLCFALESRVSVGEPFALTLPAIRASMAELASELSAQTGSDPEQIGYDPDPALEAGFGRFPPLHAARARSAGFEDDGSLPALVASALNQLNEGD